MMIEKYFELKKQSVPPNVKEYVDLYLQLKDEVAKDLNKMRLEIGEYETNQNLKTTKTNSATLSIIENIVDPSDSEIVTLVIGSVCSFV
jgi:hypothetical protein